MGRPKAKVLHLNCVVCGSGFDTPDTKRGRKKETCSKSCASRLAYRTQTITAPCSICGAHTETAKSVVNCDLPVYCEGCAQARYSLECEICGSEFMGKRGYVRCCSQECVNELNRRNLIDVKCDCCGKMFQQSSFSVYEGKRTYCSRRCSMRQYSRENPTRYGGTWPRWIRLIRDRDGHKCLMCGAVDDLEVHHFIKLTTFSNPNDAHYGENLGLFCVDCHDVVEDSGIGSLSEFYGRYSPTLRETVGGWQK